MSQLKKEKHLTICREKDENKQNFYFIAATETAEAQAETA